MNPIEVWSQWVGMNEAARVGLIHAGESRGQEILSFEYDAKWMKTRHHVLDPYLQYYSGKFFRAAVLKALVCFSILLLEIGDACCTTNTNKCSREKRNAK